MYEAYPLHQAFSQALGIKAGEVVPRLLEQDIHLPRPSGEQDVQPTGRLCRCVFVGGAQVVSTTLE